MSYDDLCAAEQNVPAGGEENLYFHSNSLERMIFYINNVTCESAVSSGNSAPVADAGSNYTIPISTPFVLAGNATDNDGDMLTYCWEQYDEDGSSNPTQGFIGTTAAGSTTAPLFRSFPPTTNSDRYFPAMTNILSGINTMKHLY